mmetsp:Transcript_35338/g.49069  ORF Transcript_35338/g.49069 Transcript_35338/m.49069 type:complete len:204 (-) Transcript_35338:1029-1640(-)
MTCWVAFLCGFRIEYIVGVKRPPPGAHVVQGSVYHLTAVQPENFMRLLEDSLTFLQLPHDGGEGVATTHVRVVHKHAPYCFPRGRHALPIFKRDRFQVFQKRFVHLGHGPLDGNLGIVYDVLEGELNAVCEDDRNASSEEALVEPQSPGGLASWSKAELGVSHVFEVLRRSLAAGLHEGGVTLAQLQQGAPGLLSLVRPVEDA